MTDQAIQRNRLTRRLVVAIFLFSAFITLIVTGLQIYYEYQKDMRRIDSQMTLVQTSYLPSLVNSLWELNNDQVAIIVKGISSIPGVEYVEIEKDGQSDTAEGELTSRHIIEKQFPLVIHLKHKEVQLGVLRVVNSIDAVYQKLVNRTQSILVANAVTIFILSGFIFLIIEYFIVRHLVEIADYTKRLDMDNLETQAVFSKTASDPASPDEIDQIMISIKQMQERINRDLSKRKRTEEALRQFECIVSNSHDMMTLLDKQFRYLEVNNAFLRAFGKSREEVIGHTVPEIFGEDFFLHNIKPNAEKCMAGEIVRFSGWFDFPAIGYLHIDIEYSPYMDSSRKVTGFTINARDITERKLAETALQESEEKFRSLFENAVVGIGISSTAGQILEINDAWLRMIGYTREAAQQVNIADLYEYPKMRHKLIDRMRRDGYVEGFECRLINRETGPFWVSLSANIIQHEGEDAIQATMLDINDKKRMEMELLQQHKMQAIGTLAGGIAHDFNNILAAIIGYTELSLVDAESDSQLRYNLREVLSAGSRAKDLVRQILTFARQAEERTKPVQVRTVIEETLHLIRSTLPTLIEIKAHLNSDAYIQCNPTQIQQIIMNICTNAAHAMETGGGVLATGLEDVTIDSASPLVQDGLKPGDYIEIMISDTGCGISPSVMKSIFEPYFTTKNFGEGTGMGLAVVHGIVEGNDGKITVESQMGKGTTFRVYWPVTEERVNRRPTRKHQLSGGTERILFIDDESSVANVASLFLQRLGYSITTQTCSMTALELFRNAPNDFDLVITDMTMPKITGDRLATEMMSIRPDLPVILCTGYSKQITDESAALIGIKAVAYKPLVQVELAKLVRKVLDASQQNSNAGG